MREERPPVGRQQEGPRDVGLDRPVLTGLARLDVDAPEAAPLLPRGDVAEAPAVREPGPAEGQARLLRHEPRLARAEVGHPERQPEARAQRHEREASPVRREPHRDLPARDRRHERRRLPRGPPVRGHLLGEDLVACPEGDVGDRSARPARARGGTRPRPSPRRSPGPAGSPARSPVAGSTATRHTVPVARPEARPDLRPPALLPREPVHVRSSLVSRRPPPSRPTVKTRVPARKEISRPSGDHAGAPCPPGPTSAIVVSRRGSPPSAPTSQIVDPSLAAERVSPAPVHAWPWNAICDPSGDHAGKEPNAVSRRGDSAERGNDPDPSAPDGVIGELPPVRREGWLHVLHPVARDRDLPRPEGEGADDDLHRRRCARWRTRSSRRPVRSVERR